MTVADLQNIVDGNFHVVDKSVGVLLHDSGFMRYKKLTERNYDYWWYEVEDVSKMSRRSFAYAWSDMEPTSKFELLKTLIPLHRPAEAIYKILNNALNILSAAADGVNTETGVSCVSEVVNMYYGGRRKSKQLTLF